MLHYQFTRFNLNEIILQYLPFTLLLVGTAYLLIFLLGLPLALFLSQHHNSWFDRFITTLAPLSSIPSWVIGILLISIFAVELKILPVSGMVDTLPPDTAWGYIPIVLKHMVLPVMAILLSLLFQLVYSWRTIFVTFGQEDYVDLGKSIGLKPRKLRKDYILKPTLPYVITSFSLILISFWQMTMALEVIFKWEGIGWLYVQRGLPNFWGESMYPGELLIALSLVVLFAYLLGMVVFMLDIIYVLVDPRIRLIQKEPILRAVQLGRNERKVSKLPYQIVYAVKSLSFRRIKPRKEQVIYRSGHATSSLRLNIKQIWNGIAKFVFELKHYPSAIIGFILILLLIAGSIYAVVKLPYKEIGSQWSRSTLTGTAEIPKLAKPTWLNLFTSSDYLSRLILKSQNGDAQRSDKLLDSGMHQITYTYRFAYDYADFPSEITIYFNGIYNEKQPFVSMLWITPDGREFKINGFSVDSTYQYDFEANIPARRLVSKNPNWQEWFNFTLVFPTPNYYVLFANPDSNTAEVVKGSYQLVMNVITFEESSDVQSELVLLGQVYGIAGTDYLRRDLVVPLFWGMPFALVIGLVGSLSTTIFSMILAATGVWFGGWMDDLIQRITEVNLVLPIMAISVLAAAYLGIDIWIILIMIVLLNIFGAPLKSFRAALLQIREAPYIEAARASGASSGRIILKYMVPRIIPVMVPQLIILIPSFVFLEATLGLFNINSNLPTWGTVIYQGLTRGALYGSRFWVLQPIALLLITGFAFGLFGSALERILNPRLQDE